MARSKLTLRKARAGAETATGFVVPRTVSHPALLEGGSDEPFRQALYLMVLAFGRLQICREAFGQAMTQTGSALTGSQFAVMIGTAYRQHAEGVSIRALAEHVQLAPTHVTTEVGRLIRKGLLTKRPNQADRRGVLVKLSQRGEAAVLQVSPFVRGVNDLLFQDVSRKDFAAISRFLSVFARNTEYAVAEIRRHERERGRRPIARRRRKRD